MMPTMPPDSHKISMKIIEAIKQHPVLYSAEVRGPPVKLQEFRQKVWKRISDELGLDPTWVRLKWKNLRDTYCRILKYKTKTDEGTRRKKWVFEDHLSFLKFPHELGYQPQCVELTEEYIREINAGGISSEGLLEQLEDRNDEDYSEYLEVLEETTADPTLMEPEMIETYKSIELQQPATQEIVIGSQKSAQRNIDNYAQEIQSKYRKIRPKRSKSNSNVPNAYSILKSNNTNTLLDANTVASPIIVTSSVLTPVTSVSTSVNESNDIKDDMDCDQFLVHENKSSIELFFASMAQTVKKFPPKAQADIKMSICKIVTEAEMRYSKEITARTTQQFVTPPGMIPKLVLIPCNKLDNQSIKD